MPASHSYHDIGRELLDLRLLYEYLSFDAVYIRDDFLKPVVGDGCFAWGDVAVIELLRYTFRHFFPICEHKKDGSVSCHPKYPILFPLQ